MRQLKKKKINYLIIDLSKTKKFKKDVHTYPVSIGQFGKIINILKENFLVKDVIDFITKDKKRSICTPFS